MNLISFTKQTNCFEHAILIKESALDRAAILKHYVEPLVSRGVSRETIVAVGLPYSANNKIPVKQGRDHFTRIADNLERIGVTNLYIADANYFKIATKKTKTANSMGTVIDMDPFQVVLGVNYQALYYNDNQANTLTLSIDTFDNLIRGNKVDIGKNIIHSAKYFRQNDWRSSTDPSPFSFLSGLHKYPLLVCDIETYSLRFQEARIGTIGFAWDQHNGGVLHGGPTNSIEYSTMKIALRNFFKLYQGQLMFHNALFDVKILIYELFMQHPGDLEGMYEGLDIFENMVDTQVITFIATNTTAGNVLNLKDNSVEFAGSYAIEEINDITKIELNTLMEYNLVDCLATWYVFNKYKGELAGDLQLQAFYHSMAQPTLVPTISMMLNGLPMNMHTLEEVHTDVTILNDRARKTITNHPSVKKAIDLIKIRKAVAANKKLKKKFKKADDIDFTFNPSSGDQIRVVLYEILKLPILELTDKKAPSTSAKAIKKLLDLDIDNQTKTLLEALQELAETDILLNTFINAFHKLAFRHTNDQTYYLNGNLKSTGTQSGRYSSSEPNMQNIPNNTRLAKLIKKIFEAPEGWVIGGADFSSLEDRINAILTGDPNKIKVYTDGYDGHCLRAYSYFGNSMPDITEDVESINSIETAYPVLRQRSKGPTFALTYEGTWKTLVKNIGLSEEEAKQIEENYHELYKVSDQFSQNNIERASETGYVRLAFGARLKTPILGKTILNSRVTPYEAQKEGRSANNAITQSWGMLTNRAVIEFYKRLRQSPHKYSVKLCNVIHDAIYLLMRDNPHVIKWVNDNLIECMQWQDDEAIRSDDVKMEAELTIGPNLLDQVKVKNRATYQELEAILSDPGFDNRISKLSSKSTN